MDWTCLIQHPKGTILRLWVTPRAARTGADNIREDRLGLKVQAPPEAGKANQAVCKWVARTFGLRPSQVRLLRGAKSRRKDILLEGLGIPQAARILGELVQGAKKQD